MVSLHGNCVFHYHHNQCSIPGWIERKRQKLCLLNLIYFNEKESYTHLRDKKKCGLVALWLLYSVKHETQVSNYIIKSFFL